MSIINVTKAFSLNLPSGPVSLEIGQHDVSEEIAGHWYTQEHCEPVVVEQALEDDGKKVKSKKQ